LGDIFLVEELIFLVEELIFLVEELIQLLHQESLVLEFMIYDPRPPFFGMQTISHAALGGFFYH
jgi:hypothetical protein